MVTGGQVQKENLSRKKKRKKEGEFLLNINLLNRARGKFQPYASEEGRRRGEIHFDKEGRA